MDDNVELKKIKLSFGKFLSQMRKIYFPEKTPNKVAEQIYGLSNSVYRQIEAGTYAAPPIYIADVICSEFETHVFWPRVLEILTFLNIVEIHAPTETRLHIFAKNGHNIDVRKKTFQSDIKRYSPELSLLITKVVDMPDENYQKLFAEYMIGKTSDDINTEDKPPATNTSESLMLTGINKISPMHHDLVLGQIDNLKETINALSYLPPLLDFYYLSNWLDINNGYVNNLTCITKRYEQLKYFKENLLLTKLLTHNESFTIKLYYLQQEGQELNEIKKVAKNFRTFLNDQSPNREFKQYIVRKENPNNLIFSQLMQYNIATRSLENKSINESTFIGENCNIYSLSKSNDRKPNICFLDNQRDIEDSNFTPYGVCCNKAHTNELLQGVRILQENSDAIWGLNYEKY